MSDTAPPLMFRWEGDAMRPKLPKLADRYFVVGEDYRMVEEHPRSKASHDHAFAWLGEAHKNLPEHLAEQYPTPDHLRKRALIDAGFYDETVIDAGSQAAALRVAAAIRSRPGEAFSLVITRGPAVVIRTARSMARGAMKPADFQAAKQAVLDTVSAMLGVTPETLSQARAAA